VTICNHKLPVALGLCACTLLPACCPDAQPRREAGSAADGARDGVVGARLSSLQTNLFDKHCVTDCHSGAGAAAGLSLSRGQSYGALVNQRSQQLSTQIRVVPGDPAASYLVKKLSGGAGIVGDVMPKLAPPLPASDVDAVRGWVTRGAPDD
jgi:hypothetical protein